MHSLLRTGKNKLWRMIHIDWWSSFTWRNRWEKKDMGNTIGIFEWKTIKIIVKRLFFSIALTISRASWWQMLETTIFCLKKSLASIIIRIWMPFPLKSIFKNHISRMTSVLMTLRIWVIQSKRSRQAKGLVGSSGKWTGLFLIEVTPGLEQTAFQVLLWNCIFFFYFSFGEREIALSLLDCQVILVVKLPLWVSHLICLAWLCTKT